MLQWVPRESRQLEVFTHLTTWRCCAMGHGVVGRFWWEEGSWMMMEDFSSLSDAKILCFYETVVGCTNGWQCFVGCGIRRQHQMALSVGKAQAFHVQ